MFSTTIASAVGIGAALLLHRYEFPGRRLLAALVPLPLMVPPFVGAVGMKQLLGRAGAFNALLERIGIGDPNAPIDWLRDGRFAVVVALTALHLYPIVFFNVQAALAGLNPEMEEAARSLGCRGLRLFRKITLPSILPSVFAATSIVFIWAFTELGVPLMCDYQRVTSVQIFAGPQGSRAQPVRLRAGRGRAGHDGRVLRARAAAGHPRGRPPDRRRQGRAGPPPASASPGAGALVAATLAAVVGAAALPNASVVLLAFARDWYGTILPSGLTLDHVRSRARATTSSSRRSATACATSRCRPRSIWSSGRRSPTWSPRAARAPRTSSTPPRCCRWRCPAW